MATTNAGNSQSKEGRPKFRTDRPQGERKDFKDRGNFNKGNFDKNKSEFKPKGGFNKSFDKSGGFGKDKDEDDKPVRRPKQTKTDSKPKEQQPDKLEIINRLEKEKKAMKKKYDESKKENKPQKHQSRPKRSGNVDWTREYENGSYDDDDLDMYY